MKKLTPVAGWFALLFAVAALIAYVLFPDKLNVALTLGFIALGAVIVIAVADRENLRRFLKGRQALYGFNAGVLILVALGIMVFANIISFRHKHRWDVTEGGLYSLAPQTQKIVSTLPRGVKLTAFFQTDDPKKSDFKNLIDGYLTLGDKLALEFVDPDKKPALAKRYGVTTYGTVVLESGEQETKVNNATEETLTNALLKVVKDDKKTIYFLDGHGEKDIDGVGKESYSAVKKALEKDNFQVQKLLLMQSGSIPEDASLLVINAPQRPLLEKETEIVEKYLDAGGAVFLLADPQMDTGLEGLLKNWGLVLNPDMIIDPLSRMFGGDFAAPVVNQYTMHDVTKDFALATIFPIVRSISTETAPGVETIELLKTGQNSWGETDFSDAKVKYDEGTEVQGSLAVLVLSTKKMPASGADKSKGAGESKEENPLTAKLVVAGDSDFAADQYFNFSGNADLFLNTASWLAEENNLISIRSRERSSQPIQLSQTQGKLIFILGVLVFPGMVALIGVKVWWRRRSL